MTAYQIDGSDVSNPISFDYEELASFGKDWTGLLICSGFYSAVAQFGGKTPSSYDDWSAADDGLPHTIKVPSVGDPTTYTTYSGVYIRAVGGTIAPPSSGIFIGASFRVTKIQVLSLPLFGA